MSAAAFHQLRALTKERLPLSHMKALVSLALQPEWRELSANLAKDCELLSERMLEIAAELELMGLAYREPVAGNARAWWIKLTKTGHAKARRIADQLATK